MSIPRVIKDAKVTQNGSVTIPADFRHRFQLSHGDKVIWLEGPDAGQLLLMPSAAYEKLIDQLNIEELREHHLETISLSKSNRAIPLVRKQTDNK